MFHARRPLWITLAVLSAAALVGALTLRPSTARAAGGFDFTRPQTVATGLATPWGMAFLPDGSALVAERDSARLLQIRAGAAPVVRGTVPGVVPGGEGGLLGLAVSPTFGQDNLVYAYLTAANDNRARFSWRIGVHVPAAPPEVERIRPPVATDASVA